MYKLIVSSLIVFVRKLDISLWLAPCNPLRAHQ